MTKAWIDKETDIEAAVIDKLRDLSLHSLDEHIEEMEAARAEVERGIDRFRCAARKFRGGLVAARNAGAIEQAEAMLNDDYLDPDYPPDAALLALRGQHLVDAMVATLRFNDELFEPDIEEAIRTLGSDRSLLDDWR